MCWLEVHAVSLQHMHLLFFHERKHQAACLSAARTRTLPDSVLLFVPMHTCTVCRMLVVAGYQACTAWLWQVPLHACNPYGGCSVCARACVVPLVGEICVCLHSAQGPG